MKDAGYITADMIMVTWRSSGSEKIAQAKADKTSVCVREYVSQRMNHEKQ